MLSLHCHPFCVARFSSIRIMRFWRQLAMELNNIPSMSNIYSSLVSKYTMHIECDNFF